MTSEVNTNHSKYSDRLIRNSIIYFINSILGLVLGFAVSILTARLLGPERYGIYNVILWLMSVVSTIVGMGLNVAITKFVSEYQGKNDKEAIEKIVRFILWIEIVLSVITTLLLVVNSTWIADYFFTPFYTKAFTLCFVGLLPGILTAVYSSVIEGIQKFRYFLYYSLFITPASFITKGAVLLSGGGIEGLLWTNLIFSVINTLFYRWVLHHETLSVGLLGNFPDKDIRNKTIKYNFSISAIMLLDKIVWDKSENFFLAKFCPAVQAGLFNMAYGLSSKFTSIIQSTLWKVLFPFMSELTGAKDHNRLQKVFFLSTRYSAFFAFPIAAAGIVLSWPLIKYSLGHEYIEGQRALQIFFFCSAFGQLATPQAAVLYAIEKQNFIIKYGAILAVIDIVFSLLLIPKYGATGAALANGIILIIAYIGGIIYTVKTANVQLPLKSLSKILYSTALMAALMQVVMKVNHELIGFIVSIPLGIIVYLGSSLFVGTFKREDLLVFQKITAILPEKPRAFLYYILKSFSEKRNTPEKT